MEITKENYRSVLGLAEFLEYMKENLEKDISKIPNQDYIDLEYLTERLDILRVDLEKYKEKMKTEAPYVFDGNLIRVDTTDAISFTSYKYYRIIDSSRCFKKGWFESDILEVTFGDYEVGVTLKKSMRVKIDDFIRDYNTYYHVEGGKLNPEWREYTKYLETLKSPE